MHFTTPSLDDYNVLVPVIGFGNGKNNLARLAIHNYAHPKTKYVGKWYCFSISITRLPSKGGLPSDVL